MDKQNTLRKENQGLRERVDQLLVEVNHWASFIRGAHLQRQGEDKLQKDKDSLKGHIKEVVGHQLMPDMVIDGHPVGNGLMSRKKSLNGLKRRTVLGRDEPTS